MLWAREAARLVKAPDVLNLISRIHIKTKKRGCIPCAGRQVNPWRSLASLSSLLGAFVTSERPCLRMDGS